jgi:hypothetical protein
MNEFENKYLAMEILKRCGVESECGDRECVYIVN